MKRLQIPQKLVYEKFKYTDKFYAHKIAAVNLSKIYFLKNAKTTCKPNNHDINRDCMTSTNINYAFSMPLQSKLQKHILKNIH